MQALLRQGLNCSLTQLVRRPTEQLPTICRQHPSAQTPSRKVPVAVAGSAAGSPLDVLQSTRPIDRIRYQSRLVFDAFDADQDGKLGPSELKAFLDFCAARLGDTPELQAARSQLASKAALRPGGAAEFEEMVDLVRAQLKILGASRTFVSAQLPNAELSRLLYKSCVTVPEMTTAMAMFRLLDTDQDNKLRLDELEKAQGIEGQYYENILEDADTDEDGFLTFEDFLTSYHKERPVILSMLVMVAHAGAFFLVLNSPLELYLRALLCIILLIKPAVITNPVMKVYNIVKALLDRLRATLELTERTGKIVTD